MHDMKDIALRNGFAAADDSAVMRVMCNGSGLFFVRHVFKQLLFTAVNKIIFGFTDKAFCFQNPAEFRPNGWRGAQSGGFNRCGVYKPGSGSFEDEIVVF